MNPSKEHGTFYRGNKLRIGAGFLFLLMGSYVFITSAVKPPIPTATSNLVLAGTGQENGAWLWTSVFKIDPAYRKTIIAGARENGINSIYISINDYISVMDIPDVSQRKKAEKTFDDTLEDFITEAHKNNIAIDAVAGAPNWGEAQSTYQADRVIEYVEQFNKTHAEKFRGLQFDVEPYLLDSYAANQKETLVGFLNLVNRTVATLNATDLQFSIVVPDFYTSHNQTALEFTFLGVSGSTFDHLLTILDKRPGSRMIVMAYRSQSSGNDGSIAVSRDEIAEANTSRTNILVAQETADVGDTSVSLYGDSKAYYAEQINDIRQAFGRDRSFAGTATDYIDTLLALH
ncbi:MAG TPA: hypothetical protein VMU13_01800 [Candidatus Paceibacterota bacterium]|nr:hypothetical protein [Candidatus Paceibacterota bacterium]